MAPLLVVIDVDVDEVGEEFHQKLWRRRFGSTVRNAFLVLHFHTFFLSLLDWHSLALARTLPRLIFNKSIKSVASIYRLAYAWTRLIQQISDLYFQLIKVSREFRSNREEITTQEFAQAALFVSHCEQQSSNWSMMRSPRIQRVRLCISSVGDKARYGIAIAVK